MKKNGIDMKWITRERPKIDRLACPWQIKKFVDKEAFLEIIHTYTPIIQKLSEEPLRKSVQVLKSIDQCVLGTHFAEIFDDFLYMISKSKGRFVSEFLPPIELSKFVCSLIELPKKAKVYNPFAGRASFGVFLDKTHKYLGQEINQVTWAIVYLRIIGYKRRIGARFINSDSLVDWNPTKKSISDKQEGNFLYPAEEEKFDLLI
jgi:type I restriction enzyme M protein